MRVKETTLRDKGAVSEETVKEMAKGLLEITDATVVIAVSGVMEFDLELTNQKSGGVWFCWHKLNTCKTLYRDLEGDRINNRQETAKIGLLGLYDFIKEI